MGKNWSVYSITIWLVIVSSSLCAQQHFLGGIIPKVAVSIPVSKNLRYISTVESRGKFLDDSGIGSSEFEQQFTDLTQVLSYKAGPVSQLNVAYTIRLFAEKLAHRSSFQYVWRQDLYKIRLSHRLIADQTFRKDQPITWRERYRLAMELPLIGDEINNKEPYFKLSNEYVVIHQKTRTNLELRLMPTIGYDLSQKQKIEAGIDYRIGNPWSRQQFWLSLAWYLTL